MKVLDKYRDKGNGNGGHRANTLFAYGGEKIIHNPNDADFPAHGGNSNINAWRRYALAFSRKGLKSMPLEQALKDAVASRFVRQATCMEHPEQLVQIGRDVFKQEAYLWVPNGDASRLQWHKELRGSVATTITSTLMPMTAFSTMTLLAGYVVRSRSEQPWLRAVKKHKRKTQ